MISKLKFSLVIFIRIFNVLDFLFSLKEYL